MADLKALVKKLTIEEHPNADALEVAVIGGYRAIVRKGEFKTGELAVYIPEQAVLPEWLIEEMGLTGRLAGKAENRVKAVKLRGVLSQGLVYPLDIDADENGVFTSMKYMKDDTLVYLFNVTEGQDVTDVLGITKYEPPIPVGMAGEVFNAGGMTVKYDIENWKNYPDVLEDGEEVVFTEKLHGTWSCFGRYDGYTIISSKGLSGKGLAFKTESDANKNNLYVRTYDMLTSRVVRRLQEFTGLNKVYVLGEIFGSGVQDLQYGFQKPEFRVFDFYGINQFGGFYFDEAEIQETMEFINAEGHLVDRVPVLYRGPFSVEVMNEYTDGMETVSGKSANIREGIVMKPVEERRHDELGRVILKNVSEKYLLRKGKTTEYQ